MHPYIRYNVERIIYDYYCKGQIRYMLGKYK
jgi:hypothetical protein